MLSVQAGRPECGSQHSYKGCVMACVCNPSVGRGGGSVETWVGPGGSVASQPSQNDKLLCHRDTAWKGRWGMIEEDLTHTHTHQSKVVLGVTCGLHNTPYTEAGLSCTVSF